MAREKPVSLDIFAKPCIPPYQTHRVFAVRCWVALSALSPMPQVLMTPGQIPWHPPRLGTQPPFRPSRLSTSMVSRSHSYTILPTVRDGSDVYSFAGRPTRFLRFLPGLRLGLLAFDPCSVRAQPAPSIALVPGRVSFERASILTYGPYILAEPHAMGDLRCERAPWSQPKARLTLNLPRVSTNWQPSIYTLSTYMTIPTELAWGDTRPESFSKGVDSPFSHWDY
jgi:hypothetical protein